MTEYQPGDSRFFAWVSVKPSPENPEPPVLYIDMRTLDRATRDLFRGIADREGDVIGRDALDELAAAEDAQ